MRRLLRRKSRSRLFLVVAAVSVITLAASSPIYSAVSGGHAVTSASAIAAARGTGASTGAAECSTAEALAVATRLQMVPDPSLPKPIARVLCGAFAGPGSQAMVAIFARGTCLPNFGWAAFRFTGGEWQLVPNGSHPRFVTTLVAVGSDLRETVPVWRSSDGPCNPTGGTRSRIWRWDGSRLVADPWKQVTKGQPEPRAFHSPSGNIECALVDNRTSAGAECWSFRPPQKVKLYPRGRITICRGSEARCKIGNLGEAPMLGYGRQITVGRFRCLSLKPGVKCTVIQSGKGFLINRAGVKRFGP
jgi:hypothetical protein